VSHLYSREHIVSMSFIAESHVFSAKTLTSAH
jgi:hypothetical protein